MTLVRKFIILRLKYIMKILRWSVITGKNHTVNPLHVLFIVTWSVLQASLPARSLEHYRSVWKEDCPASGSYQRCRDRIHSPRPCWGHDETAPISQQHDSTLKWNILKNYHFGYLLFPKKSSKIWESTGPIILLRHRESKCKQALERTTRKERI